MGKTKGKIVKSGDTGCLTVKQPDGKVIQYDYNQPCSVELGIVENAVVTCTLVPSGAATIAVAVAPIDRGEIKTIDSVSYTHLIRTLGHYPPASLKEYMQLTHLTEEYKGSNSSADYIKALLADHESILIHLRENINGYATAFHDAGTSDYITGLMEKHEKMAWMLRAHLG